MKDGTQLLSKRVKTLLTRKSDSEALVNMGIKKSQRDGAMEVAVALYEKATKGHDVSAMKEIRSLCTDEEDTKQHDITVKITDV